MDRRIAEWRERLVAVRGRSQQVWSGDLVRLPVLTIYYLAIIVALIILYGGATYTPPPCIYQGF
jgi:hypothetical protein